MKIISYITSFFLENTCFWCQKSGHFFCPQCQHDLDVYPPYCYVCKKQSSNFSVHKACQAYFPLGQVIVLTRYRNKAIKKLLRHAKYYGRYAAYDDLISANTDFFSKQISWENSVLIPIPMHFLRKWKRGYNQSERIAHILWKVCKIPVENNFIRRSKYTKQQSHLSSAGRAHNLSEAFSLMRWNIVNKNSTIYLIDDVISTGSTVLEVASVLRKNGYKKVSVVCLASD
jgi:ComF family protein